MRSLAFFIDVLGRFSEMMHKLFEHLALLDFTPFSQIFIPPFQRHAQSRMILVELLFKLLSSNRPPLAHFFKFQFILC